MTLTRTNSLSHSFLSAAFMCSIALCTGGTSDPSAEIRAKLTPIVNRLSQFHNVSFSIAVRTATGTVALTAGENDRSIGMPMTIEGRHPLGSVTKSFTASRIMQEWENGRIDIDAPISRYVDDILTRLNGTTMAELWNNDPLVDNITARLLMGMRAGLRDYNDTAYAQWTFTHPGEDWTPFDMLHTLNKSWMCKGPGGCESYASPGYELLGLALCQLQGCSKYEDLDQFAVLSPKIRSKYTGLAFPQDGPCTADPKIVHQYAMESINISDTGLVLKHFDIAKYSCLNGWSCGNIAITPTDVAEWFWDLFHGEVVSDTSLSQMLNLIPLKKGWSPGLRYGLGMMRWQFPAHVDQHNQTWTFGHGGADWGSLGAVAGYNPVYNFSVSMVTNSVCGMNCSSAYRKLFPIGVGEMYDDVYAMSGNCYMYDAVLQAISSGSAPRLNCTEYGPLDEANLGTQRLSHHEYGPVSSNYSCNYFF